MFIFYAFKQWYLDIEKPKVIYSLNFVVDNFSGSFLHPWIFLIKNLQSAEIINGTLWDFWYWLNSYILLYSDGIITSKKIHVHKFFFCCKKVKTIQTIKINVKLRRYSS